MQPTYDELRSIMRRIVNDLSDLLRFAKRMHQVADGLTPLDLLRTRITLEEGQILLDDGVVKDSNGNIVANHSKKLQECTELLSALSGLRSAIALLENDNSFLSRPGVLGVKHWDFVQKFADLEKRGGL